MKLYVSLTSIFDNQDILIETIKSILNQTKKSDNIYFYLSENPFLLDKGFKNNNNNTILLQNILKLQKI